MADSGGQRSPFGFEDAFKGGRCIQGGIRRHSRGSNADKKRYYVLYNIDNYVMGAFLAEKLP